MRSASWSASSRYWVVRKIVTPVGGEAGDDVPQHPSAARVESGRRLVEEDDARCGDERHRQVEAATHTAGIGRHRTVRSAHEIELLEQIVRTTSTSGASEVAEVGHQGQILAAAEQVVDGDILAGDADHRADCAGRCHGVVAVDGHGAGIGREQRRGDAHRGRLARTVGGRAARSPTGRDGQVDTIQNLFARHSFS